VRGVSAAGQVHSRWEHQPAAASKITQLIKCFNVKITNQERLSILLLVICDLSVCWLSLGIQAYSAPEFQN